MDNWELKADIAKLERCVRELKTEFDKFREEMRKAIPTVEDVQTDMNDYRITEKL